MGMEKMGCQRIQRQSGALEGSIYTVQPGVASLNTDRDGKSFGSFGDVGGSATVKPLFPHADALEDGLIVQLMVASVGSSAERR